jgi:hypothetical protein
MRYFFLLLAIVSLVQLLWGRILRKSAYPDFITTNIKVLHAVILFYVLLNGLSAFWSLLSAVVQPNLLMEIGNNSNGFLVCSAYLAHGTTGTILIFVCSRMSKREKKALKSYYILWSIAFVTSICLMKPLNKDHYPTEVFLLTAFFLSVIFAATIIFYLLPSTRTIWFQNSSSNRLPDRQNT